MMMLLIHGLSILLVSHSASGFSLETTRKLDLSSVANAVTVNPRNDRNNINIPAIEIASRKSFIQAVASAAAAAVVTSAPLPSFAEEDERTFTRIKKDKNPFAYTLTLPSPPSPTNKPLQTHLDEVNLPITTIGLKGYTYGVTVDPIRLESLREFGTPSEVAAKIVMAELKRDGVMDVTTGRDPVEDADTGAYDVEYISDGSRGRKHFVTRTVVKAGKLYVLTVVCKQDDWKQVEDDVWASVSTFKVLDP
jgi:hypothetical protein